MCCLADFDSVSARLPCYFLKGPLKRDFLDIYLTTFFGLHKFKKTSAMRVIFFLKTFKIESKFWKTKKKKKKRKKVFCFWGNCIWRCCYKSSVLRRQYLSLAVNVLTNSPNILHITKRDFVRLSCLHSHQ